MVGRINKAVIIRMQVAHHLVPLPGVVVEAVSVGREQVVTGLLPHQVCQPVYHRQAPVPPVVVAAVVGVVAQVAVVAVAGRDFS